MGSGETIPRTRRLVPTALELTIMSLSYPELKGFRLSGKLRVKEVIAALPPRYCIHAPRVVFPLWGKVLGKPRNVYLVQKGTGNGIGHEGQ
jgi:hypothetical protein